MKTGLNENNRVNGLFRNALKETVHSLTAHFVDDLLVKHHEIINSEPGSFDRPKRGLVMRYMFERE